MFDSYFTNAQSWGNPERDGNPAPPVDTAVLIAMLQASPDPTSKAAAAAIEHLLVEANIVKYLAKDIIEWEFNPLDMLGFFCKFTALKVRVSVLVTNGLFGDLLPPKPKEEE